jgi:chromosome segregation ATPase
MPLFPIIGYSQATLRAEYERGVQDERLHCQQNLFDAFQQLLPGMFEQIARHSQPSTFAVIRYLEETISVELTRRQQVSTYLEVENQKLKMKLKELESELEELQLGKLSRQISVLTVERNALHQQLSELLAEGEQEEHEHSAKLAQLQQEIARLDELVVKYEHRNRPQNAKH